MALVLWTISRPSASEQPEDENTLVGEPVACLDCGATIAGDATRCNACGWSFAAYTTIG